MSKTPISVLMEYLTLKRLKAPVFEEIERYGPAHQPIFRIRVISNGVKAEGEGNSKQDAKQKAVQNLLVILGVKYNSSDVKCVNEQNIAADKVRDVSRKSSTSSEESVLDEEVNFNAIGALSDLCKQNRLPLPDFKILKVEGPDHLKVFTMECCVSVVKGSGTASKKQKAMHIAASKVLEQVQKELEEKKETRRLMAAKEISTHSSDAIIKKYQKIKDPIKINKSSTNMHDCHNNYENIQDNSPTLRWLIGEEEDVEDPYCVIERIADELRVKLVIKPVNTTELKGSPKSGISMMRLTTEPPVISLGYDIEDCAVNLIDSLKVLCG